MKKIVSAAMLSFLTLTSFNVFSQEAAVAEPEKPSRYMIYGNDQDEVDRITRISEKARSEARSSERWFPSARSTASSSSAISYGDGVYVVHSSGSSSSQLSLSKTFDGESKKNEGSFEVDETVRNINLTLSGSVKSGEIKIKIILSDGDFIKELTIDESADIQFSQNINISEDVKKYYGKWRYTIESVKAEGTYRLMIHTR